MSRLTLILLLALPFCQSIQAQQTLLNPRYLEGETYAVIVGVSDYVDDRLDLSVAADDGLAVARWLHQEGFPPVMAEKMVLLLDHDATKNNIAAALDWVAAKATTKDRIIFYFSGHGAPEGLAPTDYTIQGGGNLLSHGLIKTILRKSESRNVLLLIDACHSQGSESAIYIGAVSDLLNGYVNSGFSIVSSSTIDQSSYEFAESGLSYFTHYFLQGIREGYADKDQDGIITIWEAYEYSRLNVQVMTEGAQVPQTGGDFDGKLVMRKM